MEIVNLPPYRAKPISAGEDLEPEVLFVAQFARAMRDDAGLVDETPAEGERDAVPSFAAGSDLVRMPLESLEKPEPVPLGVGTDEREQWLRRQAH